jgi:hypothetical protein
LICYQEGIFSPKKCQRPIGVSRFLQLAEAERYKLIRQLAAAERYKLIRDNCSCLFQELTGRFTLLPVSGPAQQNVNPTDFHPNCQGGERKHRNKTLGNEKSVRDSVIVRHFASLNNNPD